MNTLTIKCGKITDIILTEIMGAKMETVLGHMLVDLDGRFSSVRTGETNLGLSLFLCFLHILQLCNSNRKAALKVTQQIVCLSVCLSISLYVCLCLFVCMFLYQFV